MLNPGVKATYHEPPELIKQRQLNYVFKSRPAFVSMDLKFAEDRNRYWLRRLGALSNAVGLPTVQEHVMVVQYFPYWSKDGTAVFDGLPSQEYSLQLVREALDAGKLVMVMRAADKCDQGDPGASQRNHEQEPLPVRLAGEPPEREL